MIAVDNHKLIVVLDIDDELLYRLRESHCNDLVRVLEKAI